MRQRSSQQVYSRMLAQGMLGANFELCSGVQASKRVLQGVACDSKQALKEASGSVTPSFLPATYKTLL